MGRSFRPARIHEATTALLNTRKIARQPAWYDVVGSLPPAQAVIRTQPLPHSPRKTPKGTKKASKMFQPQKITYEEDLLRGEFFKDHPWELARPRVLLEQDGRDMYKENWKQLQQPHKSLSGESVIQRQRWLLQKDKSMTRAQAYDQARKEFYDLRLQEDVERRIAKEEALSTGAYFGKSVLEIGMELEDKSFEDWKRWATARVRELQHRHSSSNNEDEEAPNATEMEDLIEPAEAEKEEAADPETERRAK